MSSRNYEAKAEQKPKKRRAPAINPFKAKYPIDGLSEAERAEHARLAESLKRSGVDLYFWHLHSLEKLRDMEKRIIAAELIRQLGIHDLDWRDFDLVSLLDIERQLRETEPRHRKAMFYAIR